MADIIFEIFYYYFYNLYLTYIVFIIIIISMKGYNIMETIKTLLLPIPHTCVMFKLSFSSAHGTLPLLLAVL